MRTSHLALLSLAASTAAPVFAAPLSHFARSKDGAGLSTRDPRNDMPQSRSSKPEKNAAHRAVKNFKAAVANVNARGYDVQQEARGPSDDATGIVERDDIPLNSRAPTGPGITADDLIALLGSRELHPGQNIQARGLFDLFKVGLSILSQVIRRDVSPGDLLAVRDDAEDLDILKSIIGSRDSNTDPMTPEEYNELMAALTPLGRDVASDGLAARNDWDSLVKSLNTRRDESKADTLIKAILNSRDPEQETQARSDDSKADAIIKAILNSRDAEQEIQARSDNSQADAIIKAILNSRDAEQEIQARSDDSQADAIIKAILNSRDAEQETQARRDDSKADTLIKAILSSRDAEQETQARSDESADKFLKALLSSRDLSRGLTSEDLMTLASLASRALDDLD